ncbi:DUF2513 domain-containing protein [Cognatiluteimonas profundi]|uniref:DUF2513 domain-containing protein n=1 Tax=Cognatiluteimonas profundi TaxID=2594501 RepID=UPI00131E2E44|nr:DUF2513 domain-containing protein [Lysobacter profundi]
MQRDMDLLRQIVLSAEAGPPFPAIGGYTEDAIKYHKMLAIEAGLIHGKWLRDNTRITEIPATVMVTDVTWEGHDFLQAIRDEANWGKVKTFLAASGKQLSIEMIKVAVRSLFGPG